MTQTKIRIDLTQGIIEAEGTEEFVLSIYTDFKEQIQQTPVKQRSQTKTRRKTIAKKEKGESAKKRKISTGKTPPKIIKNLDLSGKGKKFSLKDFYEQYSPKSNFEKNLVFCYYLQQVIEHTPITVDHVFTCYRHIKGIKPPKALAQSLLDTAHHKGWIDTSSLENIEVSIAGINHLEHDLAKAEAS
jgi:hypothetical protein